jgi:general stress protein YciG
MCYLTDGRIKDTDLPLLLPDAATLADELVTKRLWRRTRGGYVFNDWLEWGGKRTAREIREMREKKAASGRLGGLASGRVRSKTETNANEEATNANEEATTKQAGRSKTEANLTQNRAEAGRKGGVASGNTRRSKRSKPASKPEARASPVLEPHTQPSPAIKTNATAEVVNTKVEVARPPPPNGQFDYFGGGVPGLPPERLSEEAERKRQMDALMAMTREETTP